ncbi:MAG TPA: cyclase family protein [Acidimicrobiales bacterium]|nr:cyclase family protein [Acidimicrobiales bacterium]
MTDRLPTYAQLPVTADAPPGSSWGLWDDNGALGCLNLLTPDRVRRAQSIPEAGRVHNLNLELELPSPPLFGRAAFEHVVSSLGSGVGHDDELHHWNTQSSSQWDGFRHVQHPRYGFYGGRPDEEHGIHLWARRGIVGRAVLADVWRWRSSVGRPLRPDATDGIEPSDLLGTLDAQGVTVEVGDILLVRTGWLAWYRGLDDAGRRDQAHRSSLSCGLRAGTDMAATLWDLHIAAVAADNPALEVWPPPLFTAAPRLDPQTATPEALIGGFLHFALLPLLGLPIGELFDLDALATECEGQGRYDCFFTSAPLNVHAGVASPPNALAIT